MAAGGDGPWAMAVLWSLTGVVFVFLLLRIYTRLYCISSYGVDDYLYAISFVSQKPHLCGLPALVLNAHAKLMPICPSGGTGGLLCCRASSRGIWLRPGHHQAERQRNKDAVPVPNVWADHCDGGDSYCQGLRGILSAPPCGFPMAASLCLGLRLDFQLHCWR